jgi:hypothetical protein
LPIELNPAVEGLEYAFVSTPKGVQLVRVREFFALTLAVGLAVFAYRHIPQTYFVGDDFLNLYSLSNGESLLTYLMTPHGGHMLLVRNAVFAICHALFGQQAAGYYWLALLTHLVNVALLFFIIRHTTRSVGMAVFGAGLWGASPLHLGALGDYSVYGQILATTLIAWVLLRLARLTDLLNVSAKELVAWAVALLASTMLFGVGIGAVFVFPFMLYILFPQDLRIKRTVFGFCLLAVLVFFLYAFSLWFYGYLAQKPEFAGSMAPAIISMFPAFHSGVKYLFSLFSVGIVGGLLGVFVPGALLSVSATVPFAVSIFALVLNGFTWLPTFHRRQMIAWVLLAAASYGLITLARGSFGGTATAAQASYVGATALRYHYTASLPLVAAACLAFSTFESWQIFRRIRGDLAVCVLLFLAVISLAIKPPVPEDKEWWRQQVRIVFDSIESASSRFSPGQTAYIRNEIWLPLPYTEFPGRAGLFIALTEKNELDGRSIRFYEDNEDGRVDRLRRDSNTRISQLLITTSEYEQLKLAENSIESGGH